MLKFVCQQWEQLLVRSSRPEADPKAYDSVGGYSDAIHQGAVQRFRERRTPGENHEPAARLQV